MAFFRFFSRACRALGCLCCALVGACTSGPSPTGTRATQGPFEIVTESSRVSASGQDMNVFRTRLVYTYALKHQGKTLAFSAAPDASSPPGRPDTVLEKAYFLPASQAVLVATSGSTFVVTQAAGQPVVTRLAAREFAAHQWLDSAQGQPGAKFYSPADATKESRTLAEGRLLLLFNNSSNKMGVLDVATLKFHVLSAIDRNGMDYYSDDYRDDAGPNGKARALSPGGTQFVQVATRYVNDQAQKALVVIDFSRNTHAMVPLDVDATRLNSFRKLTPEWVALNYEWTKGREGLERLSPRRPVPVRPWTGYLTDRTAESPQYQLQPVSPGMQEVLIAKLEKSRAAVRLPAKPGELGVTLQVGPDKLDLRYYASSQMLILAPALDGYTEGAIATCAAIAADFDRELGAGSHQTLFTHLAAHDIWAEH